MLSSPQTSALAQRILVADELAINRDILSAALSKQGHQLMFTEDGASAVALVQEHEFDVVLMDVQMPGVDGVEATRRIRSLGGRFAELPIIGLTTSRTAHEQARHLGAGMNECVMKPIDWEHLAAALRRHAPMPTQHSSAVTQPQLLDFKALDRLTRAVGEAALATLLQDGIHVYQGYFEAMSEAAEGRAGVVRDAHKLQGSAGTLGLQAVARAAEDIESSLKAGNDGLAFLDVLGKAIAATEATLVAQGWLRARRPVLQARGL